MTRLIWVFAGRTLILLVLSCCGSTYLTIPKPMLTMITNILAKALFKLDTTSANIIAPWVTGKISKLRSLHFAKVHLVSRHGTLSFKVCFYQLLFSMPSSYLWVVRRYIYILMSCTCIKTHLQDNIYICFCFVFQTEISELDRTGLCLNKWWEATLFLAFCLSFCLRKMLDYCACLN